MTVLFTVSSSSLMDGINRHVLAITSALSRQPDVKVGVCVLHAFGALNTSLDAQGVTNWSLGAANGHDLKGAIRFRRLLSQFKPDIVHIHVLGLFEQIVLRLAGRGIAVVTTIHGISRAITAPTALDRISHFAFYPVRPRIAGTIFISQGVYEFYAARNMVDGRHVIIYNPVRFENATNEKRKTLRRELDLHCDTQIIGTACRVAEVKDPKAFVSVMLKVLERNESVHAVVIGAGVSSIENDIRSMVAQCKMNDRFHFLGYRVDAPDLMREFNCFVMTSHWEGLPTTLLECMVQKVPFAFMSGGGGLKDVERLNAEKGPFAICVKAGAIEMMANEITRLLGNPSLARSYADRAYAVGCETFDLNRIVVQLLAFYRQVM